MTGRATMAKLPRGKRKRSQSMANGLMNPATAHGAIGSALFSPLVGGVVDQHDQMLELYELLKEVRSGKLDSTSDLLAAQAFSLDALYCEMMRRGLANLGHYPDAADRFMRLGLKAQAQSRAALEALAKLHQPREQTVRHVHVDNRGGQALIAETVQTGGANGKLDRQSHAARPAGSGAPLLGADALGWAMPSPGGEGPQAVQDARRDQSGGA